MVSHDDRPRLHDDCVEIRTVREDGESVTHMILRGLARSKNVPVSQLDSLYDDVETESVGDLLAHSRETDSNVSVTFTTDDHTVVVTSEDCVCIRDPDRAHSSFNEKN
ncbi:hypothetical protein SAMN04487967_0183 [Natronorubrum sediminis]|uniref:Halobacterial output domain-containing protein n=1 Tax=Natronorubrum sediminis TaxID=640943 RepID=A0A1H6FJR0_9EURY|nr:HalOD1 output domain-containing protein [Natronorubrum sediminis]SEH11076.1 hypothetical protein SAMN04487967_0183 [Natronorubrum sediminis]